MAEQTEFDQLAEAEFLRLMYQYRLVDMELKSLLDEKKCYLTKQNRIISIMCKENNKLKSEVLWLQQCPHSKKHSEIKRKLDLIFAQHSDMLIVFEQEKVNLWELEVHIKKVEKEMAALRKNEVSDSCYKMAISKVQKDVIKLENRLDVANKKCSAVLTINTKLRKSIDDMLQDRNCLFKEMRELQRKLEHDAKLQLFYNVKGKRRINTELEAREANKKLQLRDALEKQLAEHNKIIFKIKHITNEYDLEKLTSQYVTQEEENFALFSYVNELSHEVESLNELVQKFGDEIEKQKEHEKAASLKRRTETIAHLEQEKDIMLSKTNYALKNKNIIDGRHKFFLCGIENIFRLTKSGTVPILSILGSKNFITSHNVALFLSVIEKRVTIISCNANLEEYKILGKKDRVPKFNVRDYVKINS